MTDLPAWREHLDEHGYPLSYRRPVEVGASQPAVEEPGDFELTQERPAEVLWEDEGDPWSAA